MESFLIGWTINASLVSTSGIVKGLKKFKEDLGEGHDQELSSDLARFKLDIMNSLQSMQDHPRREISIWGAEKDLERMAEMFLKFSQDQVASIKLTSQNVLDRESNAEISLEKTDSIEESTTLTEDLRRKQLDPEAIGWIWEDQCHIGTKFQERSEGLPLLRIMVNKPGLITLANLCLYLMRNKDNPQKDHVNLDTFSGLDKNSECDLTVGVVT